MDVQQSMTTASELLARVRHGDRSALAGLFPLVYQQLRRAARRQRGRLPRHQTLNTTALVHEVFLRLMGQEAPDFVDRAHFMAVAATAMRQILIDYARRRAARKRGGNAATVPFHEIEAALEGAPDFGEEQAGALLALEIALARLDAYSERWRRIVECRFFAGMSIEETAEAVGVSPATVKRDWTLAQAWLYREMRADVE
jgi:RNA polymerase sigma factor (TIGR02999 family)